MDLRGNSKMIFGISGAYRSSFRKILAGGRDGVWGGGIILSRSTVVSDLTRVV